jgi:hypothetical protein
LDRKALRCRCDPAIPFTVVKFHRLSGQESSCKKKRAMLLAYEAQPVFIGNLKFDVIGEVLQNTNCSKCISVPQWDPEELLFVPYNALLVRPPRWVARGNTAWLRLSQAYVARATI